MTIRAMVMAAGAGTRLQPLTHEIPKPMVPICNRPVMEYTIENLKRHGITEIILNLHNHPEMIRRHFGDGSKWGVRLHYSHEPKLLGTAGGVRKAAPFLENGTFLVMSGDGLTDIDLTSLIQFHQKRKALATMALALADARFEYGIALTTPQQRIRRFIEKPSWGDVFSSQVNTGIYVFEPQILRRIKTGRSVDFGHEVWPMLLAERKPIYGKLIKDYWCDVGNLTEYRKAQRNVLEGSIDFSMPGKEIRKGVWVEPGARINRRVKLEAPCLIGRNAIVESGATIGAYSVVGKGCRIGAGSELRNCILWEDVLVGRRVRLANCVIGHRAHIIENIAMYEGAVIQTL